MIIILRDRGRVTYVGDKDSVFDVDDLQTDVGGDKDPQSNYFDLWVGEAYIEETNLSFATNG